MKIVSAQKIPSEEIFSSTKEFLLLHEKKCVSLFDRILHHEVRFFLIVGDSSEQGRGQVEGVFSYSDGGQILHCLNAPEANRDSFFRILTSFFSVFSKKADFAKLFSVIGEAKGTKIIEDAIFTAARKVPVSYEDSYFFELNDFAPIVERKESFQIEIANMNFFDELKPVQKAYEEEEVLGESQEFNPAVSAFLLKKALSRNALFVALSGRKIVGKAALNAVGENYVQIGGVYTVPEFRKKGIAKSLVQKIISEKTSSGKKIVLFAKKKNLPAQKLYESCGFERFGEFRICYYRTDRA
ncbi:MAG: GNAT family N-acetyltransferase [Treponema sp.]|nr:GNAT family N-acetyltransferase [Treponema sp.]